MTLTSGATAEASEQSPRARRTSRPLAREFDLEASGGLLGGVVIHHRVSARASVMARPARDCTTRDESDRRHGLEPMVRLFVSKLDRDEKPSEDGGG